MPSEKFAMPMSSLSEILKILSGYSHAGDKTSLEAVGKLTALSKTQISQNSAFFATAGLLSGGKTKSLTDLGKKLARAIELNISADIKSFLLEMIQQTKPLSDLITMLRIKKGMPSKDFATHVLYVSGQKDNQQNRTGANAIVDLLNMAGCIKEDGANYIATDIKFPQGKKHEPIKSTAKRVVSSEEESASTLPNSIVPIVNINIQLQIPETKDASIYENLFKALKKHLLDKHGN